MAKRKNIQQQNMPVDDNAKATMPREQKDTSASKSGMGILNIVWIGVLVMLGYFFAYNSIGEKEEIPNAPEPKERPEFEGSSWFNGRYQDKLEAYLKGDSKLGKELTAKKVQWEFDVYDKMTFEDYLKGNKGHFVGEGCIKTYLGKNYLGDSTINEQLRKAKVLQDSLKARNIDLILVYIPNKESFMPEIIPAEYLKYKRTTNNYDAYIKRSQELGIDHMDFYPVLKAMKQKFPYYPLFPQYGTHMSYFAESQAVNVVINYIERLKGVEMLHLQTGNITYPSEPKVRDGDALGKTGLKDVPPSEPLAYPEIVGYTGSPAARPVKVLGIGDSYYRLFQYMGAMQYAFNNGEYWYYNNTVNPARPDRKEVWELDLRSEIEKNEVVLLLYCGNNLPNFGNGFIEDAYLLYTDPKAYNAKVAQERPVKEQKKIIHGDPELLEEVTVNAKERNISLDSAITLMALENLGR